MTPPTILLEDENHGRRGTLAGRLRGLGYRVEESGDLRDLLERLEDELAHGLWDGAAAALVLSVACPGRWGMQIVAMLRRAGWRMPAVLLVAPGDRTAAEDAAVLGPVEIVPASSDVEHAVTAVRRVLAPPPLSTAA